jgi:hypothetical protein
LEGEGDDEGNFWAHDGRNQGADEHKKGAVGTTGNGEKDDKGKARHKNQGAGGHQDAGEDGRPRGAGDHQLAGAHLLAGDHEMRTLRKKETRDVNRIARDRR